MSIENLVVPQYGVDYDVCMFGQHHDDFSCSLVLGVVPLVSPLKFDLLYLGNIESPPFGDDT